VTVVTAVAKLLSEIDAGAPGAAERLLPLVYEELRRRAALKANWDGFQGQAVAGRPQRPVAA
jgi:hypothetical protein